MCFGVAVMFTICAPREFHPIGVQLYLSIPGAGPDWAGLQRCDPSELRTLKILGVQQLPRFGCGRSWIPGLVAGADLCWAPDTPRSTRASLVGGLAKCSSLFGLIQGGLAFGLDPCEEQGGGS